MPKKRKVKTPITCNFNEKEVLAKVFDLFDGCVPTQFLKQPREWMDMMVGVEKTEEELMGYGVCLNDFNVVHLVLLIERWEQLQQATFKNEHIRKNA